MHSIFLSNDIFQKINNKGYIVDILSFDSLTKIGQWHQDDAILKTIKRKTQ